MNTTATPRSITIGRAIRPHHRNFTGNGWRNFAEKESEPGKNLCVPAVFAEGFWKSGGGADTTRRQQRENRRPIMNEQRTFSV